MRKYLTNTNVLQRYLSCHGRTVIDVGCGNGDTVRWLAKQGVRVIGLDSREMLAKARSNPTSSTEEYIEGGAQQLPFADESVDIVLYQASFHHVPAAAMNDAASECQRVLKNSGQAVFIEPVARAGAYSELTSLIDDESKARQKAYSAIVALAKSDLTMEKEEFFYLERSFADYVHLVEFNVADTISREAILAKARKITQQFSAAAGQDFADFRYRSICRLNILVKCRP